MKRFVYLTILLLAASSLVCPAQNKQGVTVQPIRNWSGKQVSKDLLSVAPEKGYVSSDDDWTKLWRAWRKSEEVPKIDFGENLIAFCTTQSPNTCGVELKLSDDGDLQIRAFSTLIGSSAPTFNYQIVEFSRENVKTINGRSINEKPAAQKPVTAANRYGLYGKIQAKAGKGKELADLLLGGAKTLEKAKGCLLYVVSRRPDEPDAVYVFEVWESKQDHENSLKIPAVREEIKQAMPIIESVSGGVTLEILGGKGIR